MYATFVKHEHCPEGHVFEGEYTREHLMACVEKHGWTKEDVPKVNFDKLRHKAVGETEANCRIRLRAEIVKKTQEAVSALK